MSPKEKPKSLDELLGRYADSQNPSDEQLELLTNRIQRELRVQVVLQRPVKQPVTRGKLQAWIGICATAALLFVSLAVWKYGSAPISEDLVERQQPLNDSLIERQSLLYEELQRVFDQRLAWVAESSQDVLFEVDSEETRSDGKLMRIRLELTTNPGNAATTQANKIWELDVIVRSEQMVRIGGSESVPEIVLWPFVTEDGKVLVESQINLSTPVGFHHSLTSLLSPALQAEQSTFDADYVLSQSVVLLDEPAI